MKDCHSDQELLKLRNENPFLFLMNCSLILGDDKIDSSLKLASMIGIKMLVKPLRLYPIESIRSIWMSEENQNLSACIKKLILPYIIHSDERLRNTSGLLVALILQIELDSWSSIIDELVQVLNSNLSNEEPQLGVITTFSEILELPIFHSKIPIL